MRFPRPLALTIILLTTFGAASARVAGPCQIVSVEVPAKQVDAGTPIVFKAKLNAVVPTANPRFEWNINAGTITAGQGTFSVTVDTVGLAGQLVTATVSVSGISTACSTTAVESVSVLQTGPTCGLAFDEFGDLNLADENARLDNFAIQLSEYEEAVGSITVFAGRNTYDNEAIERLKRAKDYLVKIRHLKPNRIAINDGGYLEDFRMFLYVIPPGADPPSFDPGISPTDVEFTKKRPASFTEKQN